MIQTGPESSLAALPQPVIQRTVQRLSTIKRGTIFDREGNILVDDQGISGDYERIYRDPSLAHVLGYTSALRTGVSGLEETYNDTLFGYNRPETEIDRMLHRSYEGSDLVLTIDPDIQRASTEALAGRAGAVVVLDGKTGAVLALTSAPTYDPNRLLEEGYISTLSQGALINRATQGLYTPGSIWKTVTMIAALDTGQATPETVFDFGEPRVGEDGSIYYVYEVDGGVIPDSNHKERQLDLTMSYAYSANAAFAKLGDEMNPDVLIDYASRLGFSAKDYTSRFPFELPVGEPQLANDVNSIRNNNLLRASTGFGQGELLTTPINMAMVVESILNNGSIPLPYFVESILAPGGRVIRKQANKHQVPGIMKAETARQAKEIMTAMVQKLAGGESFIGYKDVVMGMKTGTAQVGGDLLPHSWLIGFAEKGSRSVVVVVFLEHGGGSHAAIPFFQQVSRAAIAKYLMQDAKP
ncbi:MAG: penicillin-binding protein 2 [Anaerolineaceae bacterium]|nr:penicillin-binding protein 2 [Anaerolineaceae bacterium]